MDHIAGGPRHNIKTSLEHIDATGTGKLIVSPSKSPKQRQAYQNQSETFLTAAKQCKTRKAGMVWVPIGRLHHRHDHSTETFPGRRRMLQQMSWLTAHPSAAEESVPYSDESTECLVRIPDTDLSSPGRGRTRAHTVSKIIRPAYLHIERQKPSRPTSPRSPHRSPGQWQSTRMHRWRLVLPRHLHMLHCTCGLAATAKTRLW